RAPRAGGADPLGRDGDVDLLERLHGRRGALRRARGGGSPDRAVTRHERLSAHRPLAIVRRIVQVIVNDEPRTLDPGATLADLVAALGLGPRRIAVEV